MDILVNQPLVVDQGSSAIRSGVAGGAEPSTVFPSYVGRVKHEKAMIGSLEGTKFVGAMARENRGLVSLSYPIKRGVVQNWQDVELIWQNLFDLPEQQLNSEEHPVLVTEPPINPYYNREQMAQMLFETFNVPSLYFGVPAVLSLYAAGKTTGLSLDVGDGVAQCVPVFQGFALNNAVMRSDLAGEYVTDFIQLLLRKQGINLMTSAEREIVKQIKDTYTELRPETVRNQSRLGGSDDSAGLGIDGNEEEDYTYKLPDGVKVKLGRRELRRAPELLFRPHIFGLEEKPVHQLITDAVANSDIDLRQPLYQSIVISGGATLTRGFGDRLLNELKEQAPPSTKIKIMAPGNRQNSAWIGGSILANLSTFKQMWLSAEEYEERPYKLHQL